MFFDKYDVLKIKRMYLYLSPLMLEFLFPILVWFKKTKYWMLGAMALFHISIAIVMNEFVLQFSMIMLISYTLFLEPQKIEKLLLKSKETILIAKQQRVTDNKVKL